MIRHAWIALSLSLAALTSHARVIDNATVIPFGPGISHVTWQGQAFTVVSGWRDNNNAHGYIALSIYADALGGNQKIPLSVVPVFEADANDPKKTHEQVVLQVSGGADCTLHGVRLFHLPKPAPLMLAIATRDVGDSYADTRPVHFDLYRLRLDNRGEPGIPPASFVFDRRIEASKSYCDVDEAFQNELGLPAVDGARLPWSGE